MSALFVHMANKASFEATVAWLVYRYKTYVCLELNFELESASELRKNKTTFSTIMRKFYLNFLTQKFTSPSNDHVHFTS